MTDFHTTIVPVRWSDIDQYGHVMNTYYLEFAQEARRAFADSEFDARGVDMNVFVRHISADYQRPLGHTVREVHVESTIAKIGTTSFVSRQTVKNAEGMVACVVETTQVAMDLDAGTSRPLTDEEREILAAHLGHDHD